MEIDANLVKKVTERILCAASPKRIILFGSAAAGRMTTDSDIDLLVLKDSPCNSRHESVRLRRALGALGHPIDLIVMDTGRFEETKDVIGGIAYPAHKYGKVIYEAS